MSLFSRFSRGLLKNRRARDSQRVKIFERNIVGNFRAREWTSSNPTIAHNFRTRSARSLDRESILPTSNFAPSLSIEYAPVNEIRDNFPA